MEWLSQDPSAPWLWAGIIFGIAGFVLAAMALPTALQMFFGRPKVSVEFKSPVIDGVIVLQCHILNRPVKNRLLRSLGVTRQSTHMNASISVYEHGTNRPFRVHGMLLINHGAGPATERAEVTSNWPAIVAPFYKMKDAATFVTNNYGAVELPAGYYVTKLSLICENREIIAIEKGLYVGKDPDELWWRD